MANNQIQIERNGSVIDSNVYIVAKLGGEYLGIANSNPIAPLHVQGNTFISGNLSIIGDINLQNRNINNVNAISINDIGEGIIFINGFASNFEIVESNTVNNGFNNVTNTGAGDLHLTKDKTGRSTLILYRANNSVYVGNNIVLENNIIANGEPGTPGQILATDGTSAYWTDPVPAGYVGSVGYTGSRGAPGVSGDGGGKYLIWSERAVGWITNTFLGLGNGSDDQTSGVLINESCEVDSIFLNSASPVVAASTVELYVNGQPSGVTATLQAGETKVIVNDVGFSLYVNDSVNFKMLNGQSIASGDRSIQAGIYILTNGAKGYTGSHGYNGSTGFTGSRGNTGYAGSSGAGLIGRPESYQHIVSNGAISYVLDQTTLVAAHILVMVNGLIQIPDRDYLVDGENITFPNPPGPPATDADIEIRYFGNVVGYQGSAGIPGPPGPPGDAGYQGSEGFFGSVGYSGSGGSGGGGAGTLQLYFGEMPPTPSSNNLWWNTANGELYVYYQDGSSNQWVIANPTQTAGFAGSVGERGDLGYTGSIGPEGQQGVTGHTGSRGFAGYTGSVGDVGYVGSSGGGGEQGYTGSIGYTGSMGIGYTGSAALLLENLVTRGTVSGLVDFDINQAYVFDITPGGPWQANFTNVSSIPSNKTASFVIAVRQGATVQMPSSVKFDGVTQTVNWQGGTQPVGNANKIDMISFTLLKGSSSSTILGQLIPFG